MSDSITGGLTFGLLDPSSPGYGGKMSKEEQRREALINSGLAQINAIYSGGTAPDYSLVTKQYSTPEWAAAKKNAVLYKAGKGGTFQPFYAPKPDPGTPSALFNAFSSGNLKGITTGLGLGGAGDLYADLFSSPPSVRDVVNHNIRNQNLFTKTDKTYAGFQPAFFEQRAKDYINYAMPQFNQQAENTRNAISYNLANRGISGGSASKKAGSDFNKTETVGRQAIADTGRQQALDLFNQLEQSRESAISQLYQSANPASATQSALATSSRLSQPSAYAPIANMFSNLLNQYAVSRFINPSYGAVTPTGGYDYNATGALPGVEQ